MAYLVIFGPLVVIFAWILLFADDRVQGLWPLMKRWKSDRAWRRLSEEQKTAVLRELFEADSRRQEARAQPLAPGARQENGTKPTSINRTVDSVDINSWNAAVHSIGVYLDKLVIEPCGLPVSDPMLVAPIIQAAAKNIRERFAIKTDPEVSS